MTLFLALTSFGGTQILSVRDIQYQEERKIAKWINIYCYYTKIWPKREDHASHPVIYLQRAIYTSLAIDLPV